jgi:hypothetical protein
MPLLKTLSQNPCRYLLKNDMVLYLLCECVCGLIFLFSRCRVCRSACFVTYSVDIDEIWYWKSTIGVVRFEIFHGSEYAF